MHILTSIYILISPGLWQSKPTIILPPMIVRAHAKSDVLPLYVPVYHVECVHGKAVHNMHKSEERKVRHVSFQTSFWRQSSCKPTFLKISRCPEEEEEIEQSTNAAACRSIHGAASSVHVPYRIDHVLSLTAGQRHPGGSWKRTSIEERTYYPPYLEFVPYCRPVEHDMIGCYQTQKRWKRHNASEAYQGTRYRRQ
jgi:hypothetical protein